MTVASIHQNSFVVNVEWSVKILQFVKNCTVASIHQNSFVVNVEFLVAHALLFYNLKKTLFVLFLQIHETPYPSFSSLSSKSSKRDQ